MSSAEFYVTDIVPNAAGHSVFYGLMNDHVSSVRVGDVFTTRYEISRDDALNGALNAPRLNVKQVSLRVEKIEMYRGQIVPELHGSTGATGGLQLVGTGLELVTEKCFLRT